MKLPAILTAMIYAAQAYAAMPYNIELENTLPANSGFSKIEYQSEGNYWHLTATENNFNDVRPTVQCKPLSQTLDTELIVLAFQYRSDKGVGNFRITTNKAGTNGSRTRTDNYIIHMPASEKWQTIRVSIQAARKNPLHKVGLAGQFFWLHFMDLVPTANLQLRNIRVEEDEASPNPVTLTISDNNIIEAEDFNMSTTGSGHSARQQDRTQIAGYTNPVPGEFPIYAFTSAGYTMIAKPEGGWDWEASAKLLQKKYQDMYAAGFNITEGTAWAGVDQAALFKDRDVNGYPIYLFENTNLKLMMRSGMNDNNEIRQYVGENMHSPNLAGYCIYDEPHCSHFDDVRTKLDRVRAVDNTHLLYGNLLHINTPPAAIGATSYDNYVERYINETCMGLLSYDYYGVRCNNPDNETEVTLMPNFFQNLEIVSKFAKAYNTKFWAFTRSSQSVYWHEVAGVMGSFKYKYPVPTEEWMRVQAFAALLYGAQGLQYWPYTSCDEGDLAPIDNMGNISQTYYYAKNINTDVKALTWVFLGAEMLRVGHTNPEPPIGCLRLTPGMLPQGVANVTTNGTGMAVGMLQNETNMFMMVLNSDIHNEQSATVTINKDMKRVLMDGTTENVAAGTYTHPLRPGSFVLYLTSETEKPIDKYISTPGQHSDYRIDAPDVAVASNPSASNGHYVADMGTSSWNIYSLLTPETANRAITPDQACENWGSSYNYTINVPEDMTADIYIGHSVPWNDYGRVASIGAEPGISYSIENNPTLNWPKQYAASMTLSIDGVELTPANQPMRPAVPETFTEDGAEFNRILADQSQWVSTKNTDGTASNVLYFWPKQGGDNPFATQYNEKPDYQAVALKAGTHKITVKSLSYPWHFDNIKIDTKNSTSGIDSVTSDNDDNAPVMWYNLQGMPVDPASAAPGLYLRRQGNKTQKIKL
ncbi:hypothetical protein [uncultured Muribaculum sp.]|uniref:hypothetical protein n=4 Tax=uncultured Muribaculum sp. TaxID=1918613 RepID=UPI0026768808|nr:hypothetical protein [uncultured Muribaculum sp.]